MNSAAVAVLRSASDVNLHRTSSRFMHRQEWRTLSRYIQQPTGGKIHAGVRWCPDLSSYRPGGQELGFEHGFTGNLSRAVWSSRFSTLPEILKQHLAFPILTLGANGTGSSMHQHEETWLHKERCLKKHEQRSNVFRRERVP